MMMFVFDDFELDEQLYELRRAGTVVRLEPKIYDVLAHLVRHRDRVVPKDELLEALWPGEFVSESVLPRCIATARKALGDPRARPRLIATIHGRGYRFVGAVRERVAGMPAPPPELPAGAPFVGREDVLARLHSALDAVWSGRGRVLLLVGEPGIGKTRTADELAGEGRRRGGHVLTARCYEGEGAPAFWPWVQLLRLAVRDLDPAGLRRDLGASAVDIAQLVPEVVEALADLPTPPILPPDERRFRLFDGIAAFFERAATARPVVLVLDDLHWADEPSLRLLGFLARGVATSRVLVLGTYRDVELRRRHPLVSLLGELAREPHYERVQLRGLVRADVARLIANAAPDPPSEELVGAVHAMTEGNPFFMGEVVRLLAAEGRLQRAAPTAGPLRLPESIREAVGRRLEGLSPACNRMLAVAAVVGREFDSAVLERVLDVVPATPGAGTPAAGDSGLLDWLDEAVGARVLVAASTALGRYGFAHALVRQTLYEELSIPVRLRLHQRTAAVLEVLHGSDLEPHLAALAHHLFQCAAAGSADQAVEYAVRAARRAVALLAYEEGALHYARAVEVLDLGTPVAADTREAQRVELLLALADAQSLAGDRPSSQENCRRAGTIARRLGRPDLMARAALGFGQRSELGPMPAPELGPLLEESLAALGEEHPALRSQLLSRMAGTVPYQDSIATRVQLSEQAVALAKGAGDSAALFDANCARLWSLLGPDHDDERLQVAAEVQALAESTGQRRYVLVAHEHRARTFLARGDLAAADRETRAFQQVAAELRQPSYRLFAEWYWAARALGDGRFADAEIAMREAFSLGARIQYPAAAGVLLWQMYWLLRQRGLHDEFDLRLPGMLEPYAVELAAAGWHELQGDARAGVARLGQAYAISSAFLAAVLAGLRAAAGRVDDAAGIFDALAAREFEDLPRDEWWLGTMAHLAELAAALGDARRAALLYRLLEPFAERNVVDQLLRTYSGSGGYFLALLAATSGRDQDAAEHFERALAMNARLGARPALLRTQYAYGRLLTRLGRRGDAGKAQALLAGALAAARELGMDGVSARIQKEIINSA